MRLTIFGGSGGTGAALIRQAIDAGHSVIAPARDPSKVIASHESLRTVCADVLDPGSLEGTVDGVEVVVSALGAPAGRKPTTVYSAGTSNILDVMQRAGVRRLLVVSAAPVISRDEVSVLERLVVYPILYRFFGESYADMARMELLLRASDSHWTVLRPPMLTNGSATGRYRTAKDRHLRGGRTISRADLATAMLRLIDDPEAVRAAVGVAY